MDQYSKPRASAGGRGSANMLPLSLEATLDEENQAVLADLDRQRSKSPSSKVGRSRNAQPVRSMLDVDSPPSTPRHGSIAGLGDTTGGSRDQRKLSAPRLDPSDPSTWTTAVKPPSPSATRTTAPTQTVGATQGLPKIQIDSKSDFEQKYNFDMASMPVSGGGPKPAQEKKSREASTGQTKTDPAARRASREAIFPSIESRASGPLLGSLSPDSPKNKPRTSSGSVSDDARRRFSNKSSSFSSAAGSEEALTRVMADEGDEDAVAEDSDEEEKRASSDSDEESSESGRGRRREQEDDNVPADEIKETQIERKAAPQAQGVRSLIEPLLSPSLPKEGSGEVHPPSSFGRSGPTAADFADEDEVENDIKKAKNLGTSISPVDSSIQDRHVRMIIRGDWLKFQDENENNNNLSPRLYLACTDLSTEASYAMEWTVGTMLRDGDTLLAIYAIEDENAVKEPENNAQVMTESAKAAQDASDVMESLTRQTTNLESKSNTKFVPAIEAPTATELSKGKYSKRETERLKALDEISTNFLKLVRKTPLQVRCMIEVIHCQSPKHLILNAIDTLEPTLCVVGTRGRSSLKGVLLGSFSNYLVTKSSVPVMVARRRLKKPHHAKVSSTSIRLSNNLTNTGMTRARKSLTQARID